MTLELELSPELEERLNFEAKILGVKLQDYALKKLATEENPTHHERKTILEMAQEMWEGIPNEEWAKIPADYASNVDKYLYQSTPTIP